MKNLLQQTFSQLKSGYWVIFGVTLFIGLLPSGTVFAMFNQFDDQRVYQLMLTGFCLLVLLISSTCRTDLLRLFFQFPRYSRILLLLLLLLGIASALTAPLKNYAFLELSLYLSLFSLSLVVASVFRQQPQAMQRLFVATCVFSCLLYQVAFFAGYIASFIENTPLEWPEPFVGFGNVRFFNQYQLWLCFFISAPLLIYPNLKSSYLTTVKILAAGWAILLFASGSRGAVIAIFLALLLTGIIFKRPAFRFIKVNLLILLAGFISSVILFKLLPLLLQSEVVTGWRTVQQLTVTDTPRLYLLNTALSYIKQHPWLGIGPMHYSYYPNSIAMHAHNSLLQWAAEFGLPSVAILASLISWGLISWVKRFYTNSLNQATDSTNTQFWMILFCAMTAGLIYSLVDGVIVMPVSQTLLAVISGLMFGSYFDSDTAIAVVIDKTKHLVTVILVAATLFTLINTVKPSIMQKLARLDEEDLFIETEFLAPRFWQHGRIPN